MSLRQKYLQVIKDIVPVGAMGVLLLLGSTAPGMAGQHPPNAQPRAGDRARVSERLAAIREAVSDAVSPNAGQGERRLVWWAWRNGGGGWRNGGWRNGGGEWRLAQRRLGQFLAQLVNGLLNKANLMAAGVCCLPSAHPQVEFGGLASGSSVMG